METIQNYLDNMFANLPKTTKVIDLKNNILFNMEEKYQELKGLGKSENEAIGIVISEFGNIDELITELGFNNDVNPSTSSDVTWEEVEAYLGAKRTMGFQVGIGVFLCILAPAMLILINSLFGAEIITIGVSKAVSKILGVIVLLVLIAIAVAIIILSELSFERYKYMEDGVSLPSSIANDLTERYNKYTPTYNLKLISAICLFILSPITLIVASLMDGIAEEIGVVILLIIVGIAVFLLISSSFIKESYEHLLEIRDHYKEEKKENNVIGAVASIVWPLAALIFLFCGFVFNQWHICWIVFPITGTLFAMFSAAYNLLTNKEV